MSTYAIELIDTDSITWFRSDWHRHRVPSAPEGHSLGAVSIKTDVDVAAHTAGLTRYLGSFDTILGQVFAFLLDDTHGNYRIQHLLRTRAPGNVTQARLLDYSILAIDNLTPGSVAGQVTSGAEPAGVVGATVTISKGGFSKSATTGALGAYVIEGIPVGTGYAMTAAKAGHVSGAASGIEIEEDTEKDQDLVLIAHGSVSGVTKDQDSTPLGSVPVTLTLASPPISYSTTSDAVTGAFLFPSVVPNAGYVLDGTKALYVSTPETITVVEGTLKEQDLTLSEYGALNGTVTDETGNVSGGTVNIVAVDTTEPVLYTGTTGADGTYSILNVAPGTYDVWFEAALHVSAKTDDVTITAAQVKTEDKVLGQYANLSGKCTAAAGGADLEGVLVALYAVYPGTISYQATSAANGTYTIANIAPGTYQVRVSKTAFVTQFEPDYAALVADADIVDKNFAMVAA